VPVEKFAKELSDREGYGAIQQEILTSKVLDYLVKEAKVEEVPEGTLTIKARLELSLIHTARRVRPCKPGRAAFFYSAAIAVMKTGAKKDDNSHHRHLIYVVDDEAMIITLIDAILAPAGYELKLFRDPELCCKALARPGTNPTW